MNSNGTRGVLNIMDYLEIIGVCLGVLYLYWEYKASAWLWLASIAMPAIYLDVYWRAGLYADFGINAYYVVASIYGLVCWLMARPKTVQSATQPQISHTPRRLYAPMAVASAMLTVVLWWMLSRYTDSTVPWADAATTALSIVALWMLARKYAEQWLVWLAVDAAYVALYAYKGLELTAVLYLAYSVVAVFGYIKWNKMIKENAS